MDSRHVLPIQAFSMKELKNRLFSEGPHAEVLEIWLDGIADLDVLKLFAWRDKLKKPFLVVNKSAKERGHFKGSAAEHLLLLKESLERGVDYVDVALDTPPQFLKKLKTSKKDTKLILSHHDFEQTPALAVLKRKVRQGYRRGADLVKISTFISTFEQNLILLSLMTWARQQKIPLIVTGMGEKATLSRVMCPILGSVFYYAPLHSDQATAPGQKTKAELEALWELLCID
ncbi:MAG: hypothetical protein ACD_28C00394G0008 [uncultured bacterium]|nr:MAG: hypothetical protein ACD_28C00394G0008 [uncultured bacterium]KKT73108.1 MAG: 3-dehydroquinate dehydratase [Candidatus Peregrinibacteria bacterium GW2011_GWA2_44_7]